MIYILIGTIIIILTYIEALGRSRKFSYYALIGICIVMALFAGLRDNVGTDWAAYFDFYKNTTNRVEIGYGTLNNLFSNLSIPYNVFLLFINAVSMTLMYFFLRKNSIFMVIGSLLFFSNLFLYLNLSGIRQAIALSITCFSITYALKKQFLKFALLVLVASSFHLTAIIFLIAYFLPRYKINYRHIIYFSIAFIGVSFFFKSISDWITLYTLKDANYYVHLQEKSESLLQLFYIGTAIRSVIVAMVIVFGRKLFQEENFRYFFNIYLFGLAIYLSSYMISPDIGVRLSSYFTIFDLVIAGNLIYVVQRKSNRIVIVTIFSAIALYKLFGYMSSDYYNYKSILEFL